MRPHCAFMTPRGFLTVLVALAAPLLLAGRADVVYGSRFISNSAHRVLYYWHSVGNRWLTAASNAGYSARLASMWPWKSMKGLP